MQFLTDVVSFCAVAVVVFVGDVVVTVFFTGGKLEEIVVNSGFCFCIGHKRKGKIRYKILSTTIITNV